MRERLRSPWIQVAGVIDAAEAATLVGAGVTHIAFPLRLAVHREDLGEDAAAAIIRDLPNTVEPVLVTYLDRARDIEPLCRALRVRTVQLHGPVDPGELARLREAAPDIVVVKSLIVRDNDPRRIVEAAQEIEALVDAFITDTFDPATGASGATGCTHDWSVSRALVRDLALPVILAGGLDPENVAEAVRRVRPAGVDAHTRLEGPSGRKDPEKVTRFVLEARRALEQIRRHSG